MSGTSRRLQVESSDALPSLSDLSLGMLAGVLSPDDPTVSPEITMLDGWASRIAGWDSLSDALDRVQASPSAADARLVELAEDLGLSRVEVVTLALALAVEENAAAGRVLAWLQRPVGGSRPTLGLIAAALDAVGLDGSGQIDRLIAGRAAETGLLESSNPAAPLPEQAVVVPVPLTLALRGHRTRWPGARSIAETGGLVLPPRIERMAEAHAADLGTGPGRTLLVRGRSARELDTVVARIAASLKRVPVLLEESPDPLRGLGVFCNVTKSLPAFVVEPAPGEQSHVPDLPGYTGPVLVLAGPDGGVDIPSGNILSWELPVPDRGERAALWKAHLPDERLAHEIAGEHRHRAGRIEELATAARRMTALHGATTVSRSDIRNAARHTEVGGLGSLAQPVAEDIPDEALVAPAVLMRSLLELEKRCRHRDGLGDGLGVTLAVRYQPGVRALFVGPSGTGKSLAAAWLGTRLGLPVYRVDLASVTSKYIGETEKNLSRLLSRAEQAEVVLLFDEADSLFGKRTEIRDSNDRYANQQTNYLLQRIETYDGIVVLTSNSRSRFDSAFTRRLDAVIEFPLPGPAERRRLWQSHLGDVSTLTGADINRLATVSDLGGGHIRNAVLAAAVSARDEGRQISLADVVWGLEGEYRKLGRQRPSDLRRARNT